MPGSRHDSTTTRHPRQAWWAGMALLAVLAFATALRWTDLADVADLRPRPDALEYEEAARSLAEGRGYRLWIAGDAYAPRYPPGMSLLLAASFPLVGEAPGSGVRLVLATALASIAGTFVLARRVGGTSAGIAAALLVATSRLHVLWSQAVMSDVPATAAVAWLACWTFALLGRRASALEGFALGVACGVAVWIRQPLALIAVAMCVANGLLPDADLRERARRVVATGAGVAAGIAPFLWLNARLFGSPLRSGYGYWAPLVGFAIGQVTGERADGIPSNLEKYVGQLLGDHTLYPWTGGVLLLLGTVVALRLGGSARRLCGFAWLVVAIYAGVVTTYSMPTNRLMLPLVPLLAATMSLALADDAPALSRRIGAVLVAASLLLFAVLPADLLGQPSAPFHDTATLEKMATATEPNAVVLAYTSPFLFERVLRRDGADRVWVPLRVDEHMLTIAARRLKPLERTPSGGGWIARPIVAGFSAARVLARIEALCRSGRPVYLSTQRANHLPFLPELERILRERFGLEQVVPGEPWAVYRVGCDAAGANRQVS